MCEYLQNQIKKINSCLLKKMYIGSFNEIHNQKYIMSKVSNMYA